MPEKDLILDGSYTPSYDEIAGYMDEAAQGLWQAMNSFVRERYNASLKIMYSKCSAKPGWNVKYQKSGKSLCTLYPEKKGFVVLVVVKLGLLPVIEGIWREFQPQVVETIKTAKPFNNTLWLMIEVNDRETFNDVKQLLLLKNEKV
ncbi:hypothetical protein OXPF_07530 [Oxobacter pfennigii]|uniref:DUF3788 domain-containing protein n=1 Tax=Oxobacter pfennigii TaxID=36849 RepID=A0A0N8NTQ9_9CLOT|nr:DUF3788 domain-containing protein [Oxobacter pfennigii]KPU45520.1 hypothetical protein OXPF_07530 [Oxobacter pfennigii]